MPSPSTKIKNIAWATTISILLFALIFVGIAIYNVATSPIYTFFSHYTSNSATSLLAASTTIISTQNKRQQQEQQQQQEQKEHDKQKQTPRHTRKKHIKSSPPPSLPTVVISSLIIAALFTTLSLTYVIVRLTKGKNTANNIIAIASKIETQPSISPPPILPSVIMQEEPPSSANIDITPDQMHDMYRIIRASLSPNDIINMYKPDLQSKKERLPLDDYFYNMALKEIDMERAPPQRHIIIGHEGSLKIHN